MTRGRIMEYRMRHRKTGTRIKRAQILIAKSFQHNSYFSALKLIKDILVLLVSCEKRV